MNNVIPTLRYLWLTTRHKAYVFRAGMRTGAPLWRLIIHDWTKYTPAEAPHYGRQFFGDKRDPEGFSRAWLHHQNSNPHHWEYWIPRTGHFKSDGDNGPLQMPSWAVREMVADWMGAGRAYEGKWPEKFEDWKWWHANRHKIRVHPATEIEIADVILRWFGYRTYTPGYDEAYVWGQLSSKAAE